MIGQMNYLDTTPKNMDNSAQRKKKISMYKSKEENPLYMEQSPKIISQNIKKKEIVLKFESQAFNERTSQFAENQLVYGGSRCLIHTLKPNNKKNITHKCLLFLNEFKRDKIMCVNLDTNQIQTLDILKVQDIRKVTSLKVLNPKYQSLSQDLLIELTYDTNIYENILQFESKVDRDLVWQAFQNLVNEVVFKKNSGNESVPLEDILKELEQNFNDNYNFDFQEIKTYVDRMQLNVSYFYINSLLNLGEEKKWANKQEIIQFLKTLVEQQDIEQIYEDLIQSDIVKQSSNKEIDAVGLLNFFQKVQHQHVNQQDIQLIIEFFVDNNQNILQQTRPVLNLEMFERLIFSKKNSIFNEDKKKIYQNLNFPITDYYINSARNVYSCCINFAQFIHFEKSETKWENQYLPLYYIIQRGIRYIEIDVWDGEGGEPVLVYGYTLTSRVKIKDFFKKLVDNIFIVNPFPFFLGIESHCEPEQNERMAQHIEEILGDHLFKLPKDFVDISEYPTPNELKNKIILLGKAPFWLLEEPDSPHSSLHSGSFGQESIDKEMVDIFKQDERLEILKKQNMDKFVSGKYTPQPKLKTFIEKCCGKESDKKRDQQTIIMQAQKEQEGKFYQYSSNRQIKNSSQVGGKRKFQDQQKRIEGYQSVQSLEKNFSFFLMNFKTGYPIMWEIYQVNDKLLKMYMEKDLRHTVIQHGNFTDIREFTRQHLMKVKPAGKKIDNQNFNPMVGFEQGVQLLMIHHQLFDQHSLVYESKFMDNGYEKCGYVLKPSLMRKYRSDQLKPMGEIMINLCIISGYRLRSSKTTPTAANVEVELLQPTYFSNERVAYQTGEVDLNNVNPIWNCNIHMKVKLPELSFLLFQVINQYDSSLLGWYSIPVDCIRQGYRVIPLRDEQMTTIYNSYILCKIDIESNQKECK